MEYISCKKVFKDPIFASFVSSWQDLENPTKNTIIEAGEYFDEDTETVRFFSKDELEKSLQKDISNFKKTTDNLKKEDFEMVGKIVIDAPQDTDEVLFLAEIMALFAKTHHLAYTFVPLFNVPWFHETIKGHHPSTKKAYSNFKKLIVEKDYSGGLLVSDYKVLQNMLPDYFNLVQGNYYGYNFFYAQNLKTVCSFHYSGQIWFYIYSQDAIKKIESFINKHNLIINTQFTSYNI